MLLVPALLLALPKSLPVQWRHPHWWRGFPLAAVILLWTVLRLVSDLNSPRVAQVIDGWRGVVAIATFVKQSKNFLTDPFDPNLPGVGSAMLFLQGVPLFQSGIVSLSFRWLQIIQILWIAASAAGVGVLARMLVGPGVSLIAVAVFLFAPYTRFVSLFPGPFLVGPIYSTAIALCALAACRRRSEAALAALGAVSGIAITYPGMVPTVALFVALTVWHLRGCWRSLWVGWAAALASFAAAVVPAVPNVLRPGPTMGHLRWDGALELIDPALLGQLALRSFSPLRTAMVSRPFDIVAAAVIAPFAHPRMSVRLWGDAIFDPVGAVLMAIGLVACVRAALGSSAARVLLLFFVAALCPAFVSPVNVVDIAHAVVLPVPAAVLAAAGFAAVQRQLGWKCGRRSLTALTVAAICLGGTVLFDMVNLRILSGSSLEIMFRALQADAADRVVVLNYPKNFRSDYMLDLRRIYTESIAAFAQERPVGYLEYGGGQFPVSELAAEGKDLLFWSPGLDQDIRVTDAVCTQWPGATVYEISDEARLGRVYAARVGSLGWEPRCPAGRWRSWNCASRSASQSGE
jgi:hypothetical protein